MWYRSRGGCHDQGHDKLDIFSRLLHHFYCALFTYRYRSFWSTMESLQAFQKVLYGSLLCSAKSFLWHYHYVASSRVAATGVGLYTFVWSTFPFPPFEPRHVQTQISAPPHSLRLDRQVLLKHPVYVLSANSLFSVAPGCLLTVAERFNIFPVAFVQK